MQNSESEDRRIFERIPVNIPLRFLNLHSNREGLAKVQDLSAKGIGLLADEELSAHSPLEMWLQIPDKNVPLYLRGEVVWSKPVESQKYRAGVSLERAELMGMSAVLRTRRSE